MVLLADAAERDDKHFEALVDDAHEALGDRLAHYELALRGARGLFDGSEAVTRDEFHRWWQGRDELRDLARALGIGFIRRVPPAEQGTYVAAMRAAGPDTFAIDPPTDREAWVVELIEPAAANANALGFDIASDPTRRAAARSALERGTAVLSEPLVLRSAPRADLGYNLFMPVARHAGALSAQEPTATSGWMYMPILVRRALQDLAPPRGELDFEL